jgi:hypothetical protein
MRIRITKQAITTLLACCLLFVFSQSALAKPGGNKPTTSSPAVVINTVTVNYTTNTVQVTGSGLDTVSEVLLGGVDVFGTISATTPNSLTLNLGTARTSPVTESGNYSLSIDGSAFSVYFSAAIFVGTGAPCPCEATWESFRKGEAGFPPFDGLAPYSVTDTGDLVEVIFIDSMLNIWILNTTYTSSTKQCDMPVDGQPYGLPSTVNEAEHAACSQYLRLLAH